VDSWHAYCRANGIDYRTDNQIAKLYVEVLGYRLVNNETVAWKDIDWAALGGDGTYLVSSYPNGRPRGSEVGHMIAVRIANGARTETHDQQGLTEPSLNKTTHNVHARYIYKT
jgi:hypothetical protein